MMRIGFLKKVMLGVTLTTLLLAGCGSSSQRVEFYTLNPLTGIQAKANTPVTDQKLSIGVGPVEIPEILDRPQIVTRSGPNKLNIDEFNRWAGRLDESFAGVLAQNISLLLATDQVAVYPWQTDFKPRYRIALKIRYFEGQWGKDVLLEALWSVSGQQSQRTSTVRKSVINEPLPPEPDYEALVAAHSRAIAQLSREIVKEIKDLQSGKN
ncbi:MAG: PqiC family protein [Desulfobacterales bacterium]|jgi:uncharacterized lipoprotein YmbA